MEQTPCVGPGMFFPSREIRVICKRKVSTPGESDPIVRGSRPLGQRVIFSFSTNERELFVDREKNQKADLALFLF